MTHLLFFKSVAVLHLYIQLLCFRHRRCTAHDHVSESFHQRETHRPRCGCDAGGARWRRHIGRVLLQAQEDHQAERLHHVLNAQVPPRAAAEQ